MNNEKEKKLLGKVYAHIYNGGVTFSIVDEHGPTLVINSSYFGNNEVTQKVMLTKQVFKELADLFAEFKDYKFSEDYCHAAGV